MLSWNLTIYIYIYLENLPTNGAIRKVNRSSCSPEEGSKEGSKDKEISPGLLVASRKELKVAKLEIDSLYLCKHIPRNIGAIMKV